MKRAVIFRMVAMGVALCVTLAAIEMGLRLAESPATDPPPRPSRLEGLPELNHVFALAAPNQRGVYNGVLHETNEFGLRSRPTRREKPKGRYRIVALGDSLMMGEGVDVDDRYMDRVEAALRSAEGSLPDDIEVVNIGLAGLSLEQAVDRLEKLGLSFDPDLLVYGFTINDIEGEGYERFVEIHRGARIEREARWSRLLSLLEARFRALRELFDPPTDSYVHELDYNYFENPPAWQGFTTQLDRLGRIADRRGICAVVLIQTHLFHLHAWHPLRPHYAAVARAARDRGFVVVESLPWFEGEDPETLWISPGDSHPNEKGHRILADALLDGLESLPARCWGIEAR